MGLIPGQRTNTGLIDTFIDSAFDTVKKVADNMPAILEVVGNAQLVAANTATTKQNTVLAQTAATEAAASQVASLDSQNAAHTSELSAAASAVITTADKLASDASAQAALASEQAANTSKVAAAASEAASLANKNAAQNSQTAAATSAIAAGNSETAALASKNAAALSETNAAASEAAALASKNAAAASEASAGTSAINAGASKDAAAVSAANAYISENAAAMSESNANASKIAAAASEAAALVSKNASAISETNAGGSAASALASKNAATLSETNAGNSASAANDSKNAAALSETNSANSAAASIDSKNAAAISETNSANSAASALASKNAAAISETNSAAHDAAALASKNAAVLSESTALGYKNAAEVSKNAAAVSETNAAASAAAAQNQLTLATAKAVIATDQAALATSKAGEAAASVTAAQNQVAIATTQAGIATTKAGEAAASAATAQGQVAMLTDEVARAEAAATAAAGSATSAGNSLSTVLTKTTESTNAAAAALAHKNAAADSDTSALASKNASALSETNAYASETAAGNSAAAANNSKVAAAASEANALSHKNAADSSKTAAAVSATAAATSEANALSHKNAAGVSATAAANSEANALSHKNAAGVSATAASDSQASAALSAANAGVSEAAAAASAAKVQQYATVVASALIFRGGWSAAGGVFPTPNLDPETSDYYRITVGGTMTGAQGNITVTAGDYLHWDMTLDQWFKIDAVDAVTSVAGRTGDVTLTKTDVGLANVQNVDQTNAANITSGTLAKERLPATIDAATTGNAATATKLATARTINGVAFDGSANITIADATKQPLDSTLTALVNLTTAADKLPYFSDVDTVALTAFPTFARSLVGVSTKEAAKILLGASGSGNYIGIPGKQGFGVGICPELPPGFLPLSGTYDVTSDDYGNYQYSDGSICVWISAFYARIGHPSNPTYATYGVNSVDVKPYSYFADVAAANAAGYFLPRCFIDGNTIKAGFFIDKYMCSNNGGIASSIKNGNPLSSGVNHNPFSGLTGAPPNNYAGAWTAAKTRGAAFFVTSRFMYAALALLSLAHGQAAISATNCAWYDASGVTNFPKGCNNNALKDTNDTVVTYTSDGYSNCGKTGSGVPFAKTTHNGQNCGVADLNGLMWEISQGVTCIAVGKAITAATQTNPVKLTMTAHGMTTGKELMVTGIVGMTQLNDKIYKVTVVDANNVTLDGVDGTAFTAYTSGGTGTYGTFYVAKESAVMANFTSGNTLATDHFGAVGVAANMDAFTPACFRTDYPNNGFAQKLGNGANQVLSAELTGNNAVLRSLGVPIALGASSAGSNLFGQDYLFQNIRNELCLLSGAHWYDGSNAGVWASYWFLIRTNSTYYVGFRSACYL